MVPYASIGTSNTGTEFNVVDGTKLEIVANPMGEDVVNTAWTGDDNFHTMTIESTTTTNTLTVDTTSIEQTNNRYQSGYIGFRNDHSNALYFDWVRVRNYTSTEPTYSFGSEESIGHSAPSITINSPTNTTYYTTSIPINISVSDEDSSAFWCEIYDDGALLTNETTNTTYTTTLTQAGGAHNISVSCEDADGDTSDDEVIYYTWVGLNLSVYDSATNNSMSNWDVFITNGTTNHSELNQTNPLLIEWSDLPTGDSNITISDGSSTKYYFNSTYQYNINNSVIIELAAELQEKNTPTVTISSSAGFIVSENTVTTISCTVPEDTPTFTLNSINITNPYTFTTQRGFYIAYCEIEETDNYKPGNISSTISVNPLVSCTSNTTFAFKQTITPDTNITMLNFAAAVLDKNLKSDLSDVYIPSALNTWINETGDIIIVNNTGLSSFDVYFGNYFANVTHEISAETGSIFNISEYSQINPATRYKLINEQTGESMVPSGATVTTTLQCSNGETYLPIQDNETELLIASNEYLTKATLRVTYTADSYYSRQFYPSEQDMLLLNFYVADAYEIAIDRIDLIMLDPSEYESKLQIYKYSESDVLIITEGYFDVSRKMTSFLIEDNDYYLRTLLDGEYTEYGRITVVEPEEKEIGQASMSLNPTSMLIADMITMNAWSDEDHETLYVVYADASNETEELNITVYHENGTVFAEETYDGSQSVSLTYNISAWSDEAFYVYWFYNHETFGNSPVSDSQVIYPDGRFDWDMDLSDDTANLISLLIIILIAGVATWYNFIAGVVSFNVSILIMKSIGWLTAMDYESIVFIIIISLISVMVYFKQGGE